MSVLDKFLSIMKLDEDEYEDDFFDDEDDEFDDYEDDDSESIVSESDDIYDVDDFDQG